MSTTQSSSEEQAQYSINPKLWGPLTWYLLHILSYAYKPELMNYYQTFFFNVVSIFPCPHCQYHYTQHLYKTPPPLKSADTLSKWVVQIHNVVNQFKRKRVLTVDEARDLYYIKNELIFNHQHLFDLLTILYESDVPLNSIINILQLLAHIIPCGACSHKLVQLMKSPATIRNIDKEDFEQVFNDFMDILENHIVPDDNKFLLQKFQFNPETLKDSPPLIELETEPTPLVAEPVEYSGLVRKLKHRIRHIKRFNNLHKHYATLADKLIV